LWIWKQQKGKILKMNKLWQIHRHMGFLLLGLMSSADDDSDSIGSESSGSGASDESSGTSDEASSLSSFYSSAESSSGGGGGRRAYRRGYRDAQGYDYNDYRRIPRGRRRY
jgi:hypothetical protein